MKPCKVKEARKILKQNKCIKDRVTRSHEMWKNNSSNKTFALPISHGNVSPGVLRQMWAFIKGN